MRITRSLPGQLVERQDSVFVLLQNILANE